MPLPIVEQYWGGVVRRLQEEVDVFNRLIGHAGEQGRANEMALTKLLEEMLPKNIGIGSGIVFDNQGTRSKQTDVILYDISGQPSVMAQANQFLYPVEVVFATIEVKTTLTTSEIDDCGEKKLALCSLNRHDSLIGPQLFVLAYHSQLKPETLAKKLREQEAQERASALCVISPGILASDAVPSDVSQGEYTTQFVYLHERDGNGTRVSGQPVRLDQVPNGAIHVLDGASYPVTKISNGIFAGEPGRALLLFCDTLLRNLAARGAIPQPVLSAYLNGIAKQTMNLGD